MVALEGRLEEAEVRSFLMDLPFVREFSIDIVDISPGKVVIELPFDERYSGPVTLFPASIVATAGDVAAVASCLSLLPRGWALATIDFTIKMIGHAKGKKLRAKGRVLQNGRTNSVGAADIYAVSDEGERLCGALLAATRNFKMK